MKINKGKIKFYFLGFLAGILNGFFGAGGGLLVVPMLEANDIEPRKAHASSIAIILPLSIISTIIYFYKGITVDYSTLMWVVPFGLIGAIIGSFLLVKMNNIVLKRIFSIIMIISAIRILLK